MCSALLSRGWSTPVFCAPPRAPCSKPSTTCLSTPSRDHVLEDLDMLAPGFGAPSISVGLEGRIEGSPKVPRERKQLCSVCTHACLSMHVPGDTCGPGSGRWWRRWWWRRWRQCGSGGGGGGCGGGCAKASSSSSSYGGGAGGGAGGGTSHPGGSNRGAHDGGSRANCSGIVLLFVRPRTRWCAAAESHPFKVVVAIIVINQLAASVAEIRRLAKEL